jgi:hydrogenase expression/formation protein HypD
MEDAGFRDPRAVAALLAAAKSKAGELGRPLVLMEVCGTHTHAIAEAGLRGKLAPEVRLVSGPGCPVCVTPVGYLDRAEALSRQRNAILCTFGDLFRVPSSTGSLERLKAEGGDVRIVYSPRDALRAARENPGREVVFLAVGFETTAPTIAAALAEAEGAGLSNFLILPGNKTVPMPLRVLAGDPTLRLDGFLLPGHVSVVTGSEAFSFLACEYGLPSAVVGFAPTDVLSGVADLAAQRLEGRARVSNLYGRAVTAQGNAAARAAMDRVFESETSDWRGLGPIPDSGLGLREAYAERDASRLAVEVPAPKEPAGCLCGEVLKGAVEPPACPLFGGACTPDLPVGACMVSSEGTCAAYYRHERWRPAGGAA